MTSRWSIDVSVEKAEQAQNKLMASDAYVRQDEVSASMFEQFNARLVRYGKVTSL